MPVSDLFRIETYTTDENVLFCAEYWERKGKRFLIDYGYKNALEVAARVAAESMREEE